MQEHRAQGSNVMDKGLCQAPGVPSRAKTDGRVCSHPAWAWC